VQILLTLHLSVPLVVAVLLLLALLVCQPGIGLRLLLSVMASLLVCRPGTGFCVLLAVAVPMLLSSYGGHAVQIVPLAISDRQLVPGGGVHNSRSASRRSVLQDVHEELQGGELHRH
jgi:hypothetical protein